MTLTFPRLRLGTIRAQVIMEKGKARLEGFHVQSPDGEAWLDGNVELRDPLGQSTMHGYLRFKPSEALAKREPTVELLNNSMSAAKRSDGFIGFRAIPADPAGLDALAVHLATYLIEGGVSS